MKVLTINGSSRGEKGLTHKLLQSFTKGLQSGGADITHYDLKDLNITPCRGCLACMHKTCGECVIKDDMKMLYHELQQSDLLVISSPVYTDNMTAFMKIFFDRCMCSMSPFLRIDDEGKVRHEYNWRMPLKFFLISTCAFPEPETFSPLLATYRAQLKNFDCASAGEIFIPGALALMTEPHLLEERLGMIEKGGEQFASGEDITTEELKLINSPILGVDEYIQIASKYENWCRKQMKERPL
jgi:hypothetical protein